MLILFLAMDFTIQPLVSYYHGAKSGGRIRQTMDLALLVAVLPDFVQFLIGQIGTRQIFAIFGKFS